MANKPLLAEAPGSTWPPELPPPNLRPRLGFREACRALGPELPPPTLSPKALSSPAPGMQVWRQ